MTTMKIAVLSFLMWNASGCFSTQPGSSSLASVVIYNTTMAAVQEATIQVFESENYEVTSKSEDQIVFVREGTQQDQIRYGRYEESLSMRVEVSLEPWRTSGVLVRADAYAVHGGSDFAAQKLMKIVKRPYQKMLDSIRESVTTSMKVY